MTSPGGPPRRLILRTFQSPGDVVMLTATVRDLHTAHPGRFVTDVRTSADAVWQHNPYRTPLREGEPDVQLLDMHYPLIHQSNQRPFHFIHGYAQYLAQQLDIDIPVTQFCGDIHLSAEEKQAPAPHRESGVPERFWIVVAGGKFDFTAKWWNPDSFQAVVNQFRSRITFVQCGEAGHWHPPLEGVVNLVGKTSLREFIRLVHHADGVLCPVTLAMHLAAAVETKPGHPPHRPCVVVAGGREPAHWEAYPQHQFLSANGALPCCATGGCWKSRCQLVGDGDEKDRRNLCDRPVQLSEDLRIPFCMEMITPADVIRRMDLYYEGGVLTRPAAEHANVGQIATAREAREESDMHETTTDDSGSDARTEESTFTPARGKRSVSFYHGLGDCTYFAHLIPLYIRRGYEIEVECTLDKATLFRGAGAQVIGRGAKDEHPWGYPATTTHVGQGRFWQGSKMGHNLSEPPLPEIGDKAELWDEYCHSTIDVRRFLPDAAIEQARRYLEPLRPPIVLLHTKGNTGQQHKSLSDEIAHEFYKSLIDRFDGTIVLLDWDDRVPRLPSYRIRHLDDLGKVSTEVLLALMSRADLMVGVDSGPLHVARCTDVPTVGLWMPGHYPTTYTLPRQQQLNVVLAGPTRQWNRFKRIPWNLYEHPGQTFDPEILADVCQRMLANPRYLPKDRIAEDVQLQQFIGTFCRGSGGNALSAYADRHRSFDILFQETAHRFSNPTFIETGTIRAEEDWGGAGFFTYLAGAFLSRLGGRLHSVDNNPQNCRFAREWTAVFGQAVTIHQDDSVRFLQRFTEPIDVLVLDSLDTDQAGHAEHAQRELEAALPNLHESSLILLDDTPWIAGAFTGKGAITVPWLLNHGWQILYAGYQVLLTR